MDKKMSQGTKNIITVVCSFIILCSIVGLILLGIGVKNADRTGTFNLFGRSYHLMQSSDMAPSINDNDMIVVKHAPATSFAQGDLVAFYQEKDGADHLLVRRLLQVNGAEYVVADEAGTQVTLSVEDTRFLGTVQSKSALLGKAIVFLQSEDGKSIFLWWSFGILFFVVGLTILLHVIFKNRHPEEPTQTIDEDENSVYGTLTKDFIFDDIDFDFDSDK